MTGCLCVLAGLLLGQADAAADDEVALEVLRLVRQLNADTLAERDGAEKALIEMGPAILDHLPTITKRTPEDVKLRLRRIQQILQQRHAEESIQASRITLKADGRPLSEVLAAIQEQSGNKIVDLRDRFGHEKTDPAITIELEETPFFEALDRVLDQAGMTVYPYTQERAVAVVARRESQKPAAGRVAYAGPFRIEATVVTARRDLRDPTGNAVQVTLVIMWEPRVRPINLVQKLEELTAVDENGGSLLPEEARGELAAMAGNEVACELQMPLKLPPRDVKRVAKLEGKLLAMVPGRVEEFRFGDLEVAKNVSKRVAGVTVTLVEVRRSFQLWEFRVSVRYDEAGESLESYRGWIFNNEAYLEDRQGGRVEVAGLETTRQTEDMVEFAYRFAPEKELHNYRFVYKTPSLVVSTDFDYALTDVELP